MTGWISPYLLATTSPVGGDSQPSSPTIVLCTGPSTPPSDNVSQTTYPLFDGDHGQRLFSQPSPAQSLPERRPFVVTGIAAHQLIQPLRHHPLSSIRIIIGRCLSQ